MGDLLSKYELLDAEGKKQLLDYLDYLLSKKQKKKAAKKFDYQAYRKKILTTSTWTEEDIAPIKEARQLINQWEIQEW